MDELLLRFLRGDIDRAEEARVEAWLAQSGENRRQLSDLRELISVAHSANTEVEPGPPPDAKRIMLIAEARRRSGRESRRFNGRAPRRLAPALAAAVALVALGDLLQPLDRLRPGTTETAELAVQQFATGSGESTTVQLNDGTLIRLGPESRLDFVPGSSGRQVTIQGRAFFAVADDQLRPFRVITPAGSARVVGTRFHVEAGVSDMQLVVVEGTVVLAGQGKEIQLHSGQMTSVTTGRVAPVQTAPSLAQLSSGWMGQFLVFQNTPLAQAVDEIAGIYGVEIRVTDPELNGRTLTMWFSDSPLDDLLTIVCSVVDARCHVEGESVTISKLPPGKGV